MKLHAGDVAALDDRREWFPVLGRRSRVSRNGPHIAVREIYLRLIGHALQKRSVSAFGQRIPSHVRDLDRLGSSKILHARSSLTQSITPAGQYSEARDVGRFLARFVQPLHPKADPKQRASLLHKA